RCFVTNSVGNVASFPARLEVARSVPYFDNRQSGLMEDGSIKLFISGLSSMGQVIVYRSNDLLEWEPVQTNAPHLGTLQLSVPVNGAAKGQFFRVAEE